MPRDGAASLCDRKPRNLTVFLRTRCGATPLPLARGGARGLAAQEALPAVNRTPLRRFKRNRSLPAALRAFGHGLGLRGTLTGSSLALGLACLAALGLIPEILVVEEVLFSRCEYKIRAAIHAFENAVLKLRHGLFPVNSFEQFVRPGRDREAPPEPYPGFWFAIPLPGATSSGYACGPTPA